MSKTSRLAEFLGEIPVAVARFTLDLPPARLDVPRLRGVWGAALHGLDKAAYDLVYKPGETKGAGRDDVPGYVLRRVATPAEPSTGSADLATKSLIELVLIGPAVQSFEAALRAWDMAAGMGLGADRRPFPILDRRMISPDGFPSPWGRSWTLDSIHEYVDEDDAASPVRLQLETPLTLQRQGRLIEQPALVDIVGKTCRRLEMFLPESLRRPWYDWRRELIEDARSRPCVGRFERPRHLHRYSARQDRDIYVPGVLGAMHFPEGAGPLLPLLMALTWIHVGKSANVGQGHVSLRFTGDESVLRQP